ncbi:hypothetical protein [Streptomyces cavernicola]|uniref:Integral membrane protein n=1 Tax=Streptomyces cavernicola TaxID=3043613 RepID=A0ABT6SIZ6_9ACTN|nr:hypothetical protein [Streptomyces sp. B-S-A6]MDI3408168.1 hypothetical protein [Streptomyces sp. B-S-A6]
MSMPLALTVVLYAFALALWSAAHAVRRPRSAEGTEGAGSAGGAEGAGGVDPRRAALWVLQAGLVVQAAIEGVSLATGRRPDDLATHLSYLVASLLLLPLFAVVLRDGRKSSSVLEAVACAAVAVVTLRLQATSGGAYA